MLSEHPVILVGSLPSGFSLNFLRLKNSTFYGRGSIRLILRPQTIDRLLIGLSVRDYDSIPPS